MTLQEGRITYHAQFVRIMYTGNWVTDVIGNILQNIWEQQRRDANWMAPLLQVEPQDQEELIDAVPLPEQDSSDQDSGNETDNFTEEWYETL